MNPGKRILIIEDERLIAQQVEQALTAEGYVVTGIASSGEAALEQAGLTRPDVVIMDIVLSGGIDGIDAAQQLLSRNIPVVYLTAYSDRHLLERAEHTEPLAYVMKPTQVGELAAVIRLALFKREMEQGRERIREQHAAAMREGDEQFRLMVAGVTDYAIFTLDTSGNVNSWNHGAERIMGYSAHQILGQSFAILFPLDDRQQNIPGRELEQARMMGSADDTRWLLRQNGERYWAEGTLTAIRDNTGEVTGFAKVTRDGTERRQMQLALRGSEERLRVALHAARMGTWQWDLRDDTDTLDDSLRALFGLTPEHEIKTIEDFFVLLHPEDRAHVRASFERTRHQGVHLDTEFRVIWPDGTERWMLDQGELMRDGDGRPAYLSGACVDITERKQAQEALRDSEERFRQTNEQLQLSLNEKDVLLKEIHHRVKNNLQVITSLLSLQSAAIHDEKIRVMFDESCNRVHSIANIHEQLYRAPDLAHIDFDSYVRTLARSLFSFYGLEQNGVRLILDTENVKLEIREAVPCGLIVNELLTNSLKHAFPEKKSGTIRISLKCSGAECVLEVADDGVGLPEGFEIKNVNSMGLQLVSILTEQLQGQLRLERNGNTRVAVIFPQARQNSASAK